MRGDNSIFSANEEIREFNLDNESFVPNEEGYVMIPVFGQLHRDFYVPLSEFSDVSSFVRIGTACYNDMGMIKIPLYISVDGVWEYDPDSWAFDEWNEMRYVSSKELHNRYLSDEYAFSIEL